MGLLCYTPLAWVAQGAAGAALQQLAEMILSTIGAGLIELGTFWTRVSPGFGLEEDGPIMYVQARLVWVVGIVLTMTLMACGIQIIVSRSNDPLARTGRALVNTIVVSGAGVTCITSLVAVSDGFSTWLMNEVTNDSASGFGASIIAYSQMPTGDGTLGVVILLGVVVILANCVQIGMMLLRSALLILVIVMFPLVAASSGTQMGQAWIKKITGFTLSLLLLKPVATIIYALGIKLMASVWAVDAGEGAFQAASDGITSFIMGSMFLIASAFAIIPLVSFIMPTVGAIGVGGGGGGGASIAAGASAIASGAITVKGHVSADKGAGASSAPRGGETSMASGAPSAPSPAAASGGTAGASGASGAASGATAAGGAASGGVLIAAQMALKAAGEVSEAIEGAVEDADGPSGAGGA